MSARERNARIKRVVKTSSSSSSREKEEEEEKEKDSSACEKAEFVR